MYSLRMSNTVNRLERRTLNLLLNVSSLLINFLNYSCSLLPLILEVKHIEVFVSGRDLLSLLDNPLLEFISLSRYASGGGLMPSLKAVNVALLQALVIFDSFFSH